MTPPDPARRRRVTIHDVAAHLGVSAATVSHALAGTGRIGADTRARVRAAADELGFRPSRAARGLRLRRHGAIAMLLPIAVDEHEDHLGVDYYMEVMAAATTAAFKHGSGLTILPGEGERVVEFVTTGTDGVLVIDPVERDGRLAAFEAASVPAVSIERDLARTDDPWWVGGDHRHNTFTVLDHLADGDARRIALLSLDRPWSWAVETEAAYTAWTARHRREPLLARVADTHVGDLEAAVDALLDEGVDAVFAATDHFAVAVLHAAAARGLRLPDDLQLVSGVDGTGARLGVPRVTALDQRPADQARAAVELLMDRIAGTAHDAATVMPGVLRVRATTRAGDAGDPS